MRWRQHAVATVVILSTGALGALTLGDRSAGATPAGPLAHSTKQKAAATTTTLRASRSSPAPHGSGLTLIATVAPAVPGDVTFYDGQFAFARRKVADGAATVRLTPTDGHHHYRAVFTPSRPAAYAASRSRRIAYRVASATATTVGLSMADIPTRAGQPTVLDAQVQAGNRTPPGRIRFEDNGRPLGVATVSARGEARLRLGFGPGAHSVTATFVPADPRQYAASTSLPVTFQLVSAPPSSGPDDPIEADVPAGSLSITTPYSASNPLAVGDLALDDRGAQLSATTPFGDGTVAGSIEIVDTRGGNLPWSASASATPLSNGAGGRISSENLGLTGLHAIYVPGNALQAGSLYLKDIPAASPAVGPDDRGPDGLRGGGHVLAATGGAGSGTVGITGTLSVKAPTSAPSGRYAGTITFTVI